MSRSKPSPSLTSQSTEHLPDSLPEQLADHLTDRTVYLTAPAYAPNTPTQFNQTLQWAQWWSTHLKSQLVVSPLMQQFLPKGQWHDIDQRRADWQDALQADFILCYRGGYGCTHLIETTQQYFAQRNLADLTIPTLIGFSDITVLHACLWQIKSTYDQHINTHYQGLYTPLGQINHYPRLIQSQTNWIQKKAITLHSPHSHTNEDPNPQPNPQPHSQTHYQPHFKTNPSDQRANTNDFKTPITGRSFPACLSVLASLCGTWAQPDLTDCIVFLEDIDERPYRWDRYLNQLHQSGVFDGIHALVFGASTYKRQADSHEPTIAQIAQHWQHKLNRPVLTQRDFGHMQDPVAIAYNWTCTIETNGAIQMQPPSNDQ